MIRQMLTVKDFHLIHSLGKVEILGIPAGFSHVWIDFSILCMMGNSIISQRCCQIDSSEQQISQWLLLCGSLTYRQTMGWTLVGLVSKQWEEPGLQDELYL